MSKKSNKRDAIEDIVKNLRSSFKDMSYPTRKEVWKAITSEKGKKEINKIIVNPNRQIDSLLIKNFSFKEWINKTG